ncbi:MAG: response regulator transcription factor [Solirubrobacterales bacterium]|nr:response regulator transcription factor [Solirubrobacterales bacterium]MBV9715596.1 response regulator transcription factor [Solirubrobacterales bacterium]
MELAPATILVVEDEPITRAFLVDNLTADGFELLAAESAAEAENLMESAYPDLAILDLGLPDRDGLDLIRRVRTSGREAGRIDPDLPLLVLSGRATDLHRLRGFDRGCDDYVTKPFSYHELRARVAALLRRSRVRPGAGRRRIGPLELDPVSRRVWLYGDEVTLSNKEYALLCALAADPIRVFTREELLRGVWGFRALGATRTLDSHAFRLRRKLNHKGDRFVVNVWGVGYRLLDGAVS